jgi:hypothetical protein
MKKIISIIGAFALVMTGCSDSDVIQDENLMKSVNLQGSSTQCFPDYVGLESNLPATLEATTTAKPGIDSYFTISINDTGLAGEGIAAWCVDVARSLDVDHTFVADVYSSSESLPSGIVDKPDNFDLINWIINQNFIGKTSLSGGVYTFGDVQWAIWELIDNSNCVACAFLGEGWSVVKGQEIVDAALANGDGFVPACEQLIAIVLMPKDNSQPIFITQKVPCDCREVECETAFARGENGSTCFLDTDPVSFKRWGWTIGPLSEGNYTYDIYAGAGQCDISKGTLVGTVDVSYIDGTVEFDYNIDAGYSVDETHSYAGKNMYPTDKKGKPTVAPGQYTIGENLSGEIYVIAHAVVCN